MVFFGVMFVLLASNGTNTRREFHAQPLRVRAPDVTSGRRAGVTRAFASRQRHHGSRTARKPIMRCACSDGHAAERAEVRKSNASTKKLPPRTTR
jgi:hypothetical protein